MSWRRDGTLMTPNGVEIDLTNGQDWITVKGATDESCERLAKRLVNLLNTRAGRTEAE